MRVFPEKYMPINILPDVKIKTVKIYFLKPADRKIINDIFDKLHVQGRMEFTTQPTPHGYSVFVIWKTIRKNRVVIIIRGFKKITVTNSYFMPLQSNITFTITGC